MHPFTEHTTDRSRVIEAARQHISEIPGIEILNFPTLSDPWVRNQTGKVLIDSCLFEPQSEAATAWVREIVQREGLVGEQLFYWSTNKPNPGYAWVRANFDSALKWVDRLWKLTEYLWFISPNLSEWVLISSMGWELSAHRKTRNVSKNELISRPINLKDMAAVRRLDNDYALSSDIDGDLWLWHIPDRRADKVYLGYSNLADAHRIDDRRVISLQTGAKLVLWDTVSGEIIRAFKSYQISSVRSIVPMDSKTVAASIRDGADEYLATWDVSSGEIKQAYKHDTPISDLIHLHGSHIMTASYDSAKLHIWDVEKGQVIRTFEKRGGHINALKRIDQDHVVSGSQDGIGRLWNISTGDTVAEFRASRPIQRLARVGDNVLALCGNALSIPADYLLLLWRPFEHGELTSFELSTQPAPPIALESIDETTFAVQLDKFRLFQIVQNRDRLSIVPH